MDYSIFLKKVEDYVKGFMQGHKDLPLYYHNLQHTENVVASAKQIIDNYKLSDGEIFITVTSCWFHDIGQYETQVNHELASALRAEIFLKTFGVEEAIIDAIKNCILATKLPQTPHNQLEQIVCDADLFNFGTQEFLKQSLLVKKELETVHKFQISETDWWNSTISLMESHHFHTSYCRDALNDRKHYNLENLKVMIANQKNEPPKTELPKNTKPETCVFTTAVLSSLNHKA